MIRQAALFHNRERRRALQNEGRFSGFVASNFDLGTVAATGDSPNPFVMPAGARIGISFDQILTASQLQLKVGARTLGTPALAANRIYRLDYFEADVSLIPTCAIAGTVTLHLIDQNNRTRAIATGVFS